MLTLLHGEDTLASYQELQNILKKYQKLPRLRLSPENSHSAFQAIFTIDMFEPKKLIIAQDLICQKQIDPKELNNLPITHQIIFWEKKELPRLTLNHFPKETTIKLFKPDPILFKFLDSIGAKNSLQQLHLKKLQDTKLSLTWQIENRLYLLILTKLGYSAKKISEITKKPLADWKMRKLQQQAKSLNLGQIKRLFSSTLKIETMIKSGQTNQDEKDLISLMLFKHFPN